MSESMLSSIQARSGGQDAVRVTTTGDTGAGHSGEAKLQFRDFLQGAGPRSEAVEPEGETGLLMTGSAAGLAAVTGSGPAASGMAAALEPTAVSSLEADAEPWTFLAPTVSGPRARIGGSAPFRIYARAADLPHDPGKATVHPAERGEENRR